MTVKVHIQDISIPKDSIILDRQFTVTLCIQDDVPDCQKLLVRFPWEVMCDEVLY